MCGAHNLAAPLALQNPVPKVSSQYKPVKKSMSKAVLKSLDNDLSAPLLEGRALDDLRTASADDGAFSSMLTSFKNVGQDPLYVSMMRPETAESVDAPLAQVPDILLEDLVFNHLAESVLGIKRSASLDMDPIAAGRTELSRCLSSVRNATTRA